MNQSDGVIAVGERLSWGEAPFSITANRDLSDLNAVIKDGDFVTCLTGAVDYWSCFIGICTANDRSFDTSDIIL